VTLLADGIAGFATATGAVDAGLSESGDDCIVINPIVNNAAATPQTPAPM